MFTAKLELTKNYTEWSSIECRKPNELTLANHKAQRQHSESINTQGKIH